MSPQKSPSAGPFGAPTFAPFYGPPRAPPCILSGTLWAELSLGHFIFFCAGNRETFYFMLWLVGNNYTHYGRQQQ